MNKYVETKRQNFVHDYKLMRKRYLIDKLFKYCGMSAVIMSILFLFTIFGSIFYNGYTAFIYHEMRLEIDVPQDYKEAHSGFDRREQKAYQKKILIDALRGNFPHVVKEDELALLYGFVSKRSQRDLEDYIEKHPKVIGTKANIWLGVSSELDLVLKNKDHKKLSAAQDAWISYLERNNRLKTSANWLFFVSPDSREPELAGIYSGIIGTLLTLAIAVIFALPVALFASLYLEEFAPENKYTDFLEVCINNLAAVPSIVYGLLGLAIYISLIGMPRSSSFAGGLTLALMILPTMIITTRQAIKAVPKSIKDGVMALGASKMQISFHHTLPLAIPGILTGFILSVSRAIGETAPLVMIGMYAFIAEVPKSLADPAATLPVQIYLWSDNPELGFVEKTSGAIIVLLFMLIFINYLAIYFRRKYEKHW